MMNLTMLIDQELNEEKKRRNCFVMNREDQKSIIPWQKTSVADKDPLPLPEHIDENELESRERSDRRPAR